MLKYLLTAMLRRSRRNIILLVGILALSSGLSTYVSANQYATVTVESVLDEHWRGAYDILVRPADSVRPTEKEFGLVESNYLSVGTSGISVAQWKQIEGLEGVEIAAPVATIGYLRNLAGSITMTIPPPEEATLFGVSLAISSTNGYNTTTLINRNEYFLLNQAPEDNKADLDRVIQLVTSPGVIASEVSYDINVGSPPIMWTLMAGIDPEAESQLTGLDQSIVAGDYLAGNDGYTTDKIPERESPEDLETIHSGDHMEIMINRHINPDGPFIPIVFAATSYISLPTHIVVNKLQVPDQKTIELGRAAGQEGYGPGRSLDDMFANVRAFFDALQLPVVEAMANASLDYGSLIRPMSIHALNVNLMTRPGSIRTMRGLEQRPKGDYEAPPFIYDQGLEKAYRPGAIDYRTHEVGFETNGSIVLAAVPKADAQTIISVTGEVAFRSLPLSAPAMAPPLPPDAKKKGITSQYTFHQVGSYDLNRLPDYVRNPDPLTYVPLGIYSPPLVRLVRDPQGNPLPGGPVPLHPTLNPASFIPGPPLALTNIASARFFRGDNCIDAIRVRVAGIHRYTPENVARVERVAQEIIEKTGLHVDIVAGSSPQKVLVYIPGSPEAGIEPLGYVEEEWTTLGATATIRTGIDRASILMLGAVGASGLLYLICQSLLSTLSRRRELALLQAVGWRRRHVGSLIAGEAAILGALGGACASALALLIARALGLTGALPVEQTVGVGVVVFLLYLVASLGPALWVVRQPVAELLQRGEVSLSFLGIAKARRANKGEGEHTRPEKLRRAVAIKGAGLRGLASLAWRNLTRRRLRALLAGATVALATCLLMVLAMLLTTLGGTLRVTLLGQYVGITVQPYHYIMVCSTVVMGLLAVADHLAIGILERGHELALLQAVGWRAGAVRLSLLMEGVWLALVGGTAGALVALFVGIASGAILGAGSALLLSALWILPVVIIAMLTLCILSALYAITLTPSQSLVRAMQQ